MHLNRIKKLLKTAIDGLPPKEQEQKQERDLEHDSEPDSDGSAQTKTKKPSVLEQLWSARKKSKEAKGKTKDPEKDTTGDKNTGKDALKPKKQKGGPEL